MGSFSNAIEEFRKYIIENYNPKDGMIKLKIRHTYGVVDASEYIAKNIGLDNENVQLAKLIALLHDIGRFEQAKEYKDYRDYKNIDHAELGVKILFEDGLIRRFIQDSKYDNIILKAIRNHNKLKIEDGLNEKELLHAKIIRDADKTDNFRVKVEDSFEDIANLTREELENSNITDKIYNDFMNNKLIVISERKEPLDYWISYIAFIFDYNFEIGLKYIYDGNYVNTMIDRIDYKRDEVKEKMNRIRKHALNFLEDKIYSI